MKKLLFMAFISTIATANLPANEVNEIEMPTIKFETKQTKKYDLEKVYSGEGIEISVKIKGDLAEVSINNGKTVKLAKKTSASGASYGNGTIEVMLKGNTLFYDKNGESKTLLEKTKDSNHTYKAVFVNKTQTLEISVNNEELEAKLNGKKLGNGTFYIMKNTSEVTYSDGIIDIILNGDNATINNDGKISKLKLKSSEEKAYNEVHIYDATYKSGNETLMLYIKNDVAEVKVNGKTYSNLTKRISASGGIYSNDKVELLLKADRAYFNDKEYKRVSFTERDFSGKAESKKF